MDCTLTLHETRVVASLIEKELTTPDYYPMTINSLVNACNQKSNRSPVMSLTADEVEAALEGLRAKHLAWRRSCAGSRVPKFEHNFNVKWDLSQSEVAVLCILLLRGAQTIGEIRNRTSRMHNFTTLDEVRATIDKLNAHEDGPFIIKMPRQPGCKENRFMHLLAGEPPSEGECEWLEDSPPLVSSTPREENNSRLQALEERVDSLQQELHLLQSQFDDFKRAFD